MLNDDCRRFVQFLQERDPVIVTEWHSSTSDEIQSVIHPWDNGTTYCIWNQRIVPSLSREVTGQFFNISFAAPVIQFSYANPEAEPWNGQPSLVQGRIWASFQTDDKAFESWYDAAVRWVGKNFVRDQALGFDRDSVGPAAYEWFKNGGLLLPSFRPPITDAWLDWASVQNQHRDKLRAS
jgi:hypothetical protein